MSFDQIDLQWFAAEVQKKPLNISSGKPGRKAGLQKVLT